MMNTRAILLAYATRYGLTREGAEAIAAEPREAGLEVDIQPMREVKILDKYDALMLGAAMLQSRRAIRHPMLGYLWRPV
jgi:menaquinone-dependent protoporphyrinogen oxidase